MSIGRLACEDRTPGRVGWPGTWEAVTHTYCRPTSFALRRAVGRSDACLRQLHSLVEDNELQPSDVLAFRPAGALEVTLEVLGRGTEVGGEGHVHVCAGWGGGCRWWWV